MAADVELISEYVNRSGIESDTAFILKQLQDVQNALNATNKIKVTLDSAKNFRQAAEATTGLKAATVQLVDAQGRLISSTTNTAGGTEKAATGARKAKDAYAQLSDEIKKAERNVINLSLAGAPTEEIEKAAAKAAELKARLQEAKDAAKGSKGVEFTSNLDELEAERKAAEKTGTAVSDLDKQQADAVQSAQEWAAAQGDAGDAAAGTAEQIQHLADAFENTETPFSNLTGTFEANIKTQIEYKNRLKEISAELKELNQDPQGNSSRIAALTKEQQELKIASSEVGQTINAQIKYLQAAEGSTDQLAQKLGLMKDAFRQMSEAEKQSQFGKDFLTQIKALDDEVKRQDASIGNFQRNVGNYANSLSPFFDKLAEQITKLKQEQQGLQDLSSRNPIGFQVGGGADRLNQVTGFIQKLEQVQQVGFKTSGNPAQQINTVDKALQDAAKDGAHTNEVLKDLVQSLNEIKGSASVTGTTFSGAMRVLESELTNVREKLKDPALSGAQLKKLEQEEQLLSQLTTNLSKVFGSTREQLRAFTEASIQLGTQMGATSDVVVEFQTEVGSAINEVNDLKETIKLQSGDTKFLTGAVAAVNGLAGAYGAAQGAVQLFGNDSEELQRTMVKLQALLTIINGLQAVENALQTESGAIQSILAARMGLLNAAKALQARLFGATAAAATVEATAMTEAAVASEATAVAQTEVAATAGAAATAMEGEAAATAAATTATRTFGTAFAATGIGALILAVGAAVVYLVSKINDWVQSNGKALEQQNKLNDAIKDGNALLVEQAALFVRSQEGFKNYLQKQLDFSSAAGQSQMRQFAIRKQIAQEEKVLADTQVQQLGVTQKQQSALLSQIESLQGRRQQFVMQLQDAIKDKDTTGQEAIQKNIEATDKALQSLTPLYEGVVAARQRQVDANKNLGQIDIEEAKFEADERRKLILESTKTEAEAIKFRNETILSSDRSSLNDRLTALKSNAEQAKRVIRAETADVFKDPSTEGTAARPLAIKREAAEIKKIDKQLSIDRFNEIFADRVRLVTAETDTAKQRVQVDIDANKEIVQNQVFTLQQRLQAQAEYNTDQKKLLDDQLRLRLVNAGFSDEEIETFKKTGKAEIEGKRITNAELLDIQAEYEAGVLKLSTDNGKAVTDILRSELAKQKALFDQNIEDIQRSYDHVDLSLHIDYSDEIVALNDALKKREITVEQYARRREEIEFQSQHKITENAIHSLEDQLSKFQDTEEKEVSARAKVEALKQELSQATTKEMKAEIKKQIEIAEDQLKIAQATNAEYEKLAAQLAALKAKYSDETKGNDDKTKENDKQRATKYLDAAIALNEQLGSLSDALADRRIANIKREQDALEERYNREIDIINQTTTNSVDREKKIADAEARHAAQRNALDQQEKAANLKKAQFEKASTITSIILNTAKAIVQDLGNPFKIVIDAAIGATQLATAIATPLPRYFRGKNVSDAPKTSMDTYEGPAVVGDGNKSELIIREDGRMEVTPAQSTITYLKSKDIVLPDAQKALQQMHEVTNNMDNRVSQVSSTTTMHTYQMARHYESTKSEDVHYKRFNDTMRKGFAGLEHVIKNKKELHVHFPDAGKQFVHSGKSWQEIVNK